jgi:hypothetical protein
MEIDAVPSIRITAVTIALVATASAVALGADPPPLPTPHPPAALANTSLLWCGDVVTPRADPSLYRDEPAYRGNSMPTGRIQRWAKGKPGYVDVWIDRDNHGWINAMFTESVAERQAELEREFPAVGVVAVQVENSRRDLRRLATRVGTFVEERQLEAGWGWGNADNLVQLSLSVVTDEVVQALAAEFAGAPICIEGADPADLAPPGDQPLSGDGWTMLGSTQNQGPAHEVGIAAGPTAYEDIWRRSNLAGSPPPVEFVTSVVVWFAEGHGSSCPMRRMEEIIVDHEHGQVYPLTVDPENHMGCTDDLTGAWQFVAALERDQLPSGPFEIGLYGDGQGGELFRALHVEADLSVPGATLDEPAEGVG